MMYVMVTVKFTLNQTSRTEHVVGTGINATFPTNIVAFNYNLNNCLLMFSNKTYIFELRLTIWDMYASAYSDEITRAITQLV